MLAAFRLIKGNAFVAVQRTALTSDGKRLVGPDGKKLKPKMFGPVKDSAVKLDEDAAVTQGLTIGEGVETCLTARQLGFAPTWALGGVYSIAAFPVLVGIEALTILAERGEPSIRAIEVCGRRWHEAGREVLIIRPRIGGSDVNDALMERVR
jgi:hypothetical protein